MLKNLNFGRLLRYNGTTGMDEIYKILNVMYKSSKWPII